MSKTALAILVFSALSGCSSTDNESVDVAGIRDSLITGLDESSTGYWECTFDISATVEVETGTNTITFWENGRGIEGGGQLYSWSVTPDGTVEGVFDSGERTFVFEDIVFGNNSFTALDASTRDVDTPEERTIVFNSDCARF
ncbi:MAG: hypothetical protein V3U76_12995 [Granulosicoccus sp.]